MDGMSGEAQGTRTSKLLKHWICQESWVYDGVVVGVGLKEHLSPGGGWQNLRKQI